MRELLEKLEEMAFDMSDEQVYLACIADDSGNGWENISDIRSLCRIINEKVEKHCKRRLHRS